VPSTSCAMSEAPGTAGIYEDNDCLVESHHDRRRSTASAFPCHAGVSDQLGRSRVSTCATQPSPRSHASCSGSFLLSWRVPGRSFA
jgi:hypothetical protein